MADRLDDQLVIGVASSALFDLTESQAYFEQTDEESYRRYQDERLDEPLPKGAAFEFIRRLLSLNELRPDEPFVEVIVMSKNDPVTGMRVMRSIEHYKLPITRAVFSRGRPTHQYIPAYSMSLFLSEDKQAVKAAVAAGHPAGRVLPGAVQYDEADRELRIAFDFDGVLGNDSAETVYKTHGMGPYQEHELENREVPLDPGPFKELARDLNVIQKFEQELARQDPTYVPRLRISLVTARNAPAHERAVNSLRDWGVTVDEAFFLGGVTKARVLRVLRPHVFFDDQTSHLEGSGEVYAGVHVPYGVANN